MFVPIRDTFVMSSQFNFIGEDLKFYPHFDNFISIKNIKKLVNSPQQVAKHSFYPFIRYNEEWQPYRKKDEKPDKKSRPIRYAARGDAYIFMYYRSVLSKLYEKKLIELSIQDCPIAYRRILKENQKGKCNIDFAKDAFDEIDRQKNCFAIALDIKGYFENLDHKRIQEIWCQLLDVDKLSKDHYAVFKNITQYRYVDQEQLYERLGYVETIIDNRNKKCKKHTKYKDIPRKLCSNKAFREKICGNDSIIQENDKTYGIPQGAPISDLIANFYLLEFDKVINQFVNQYNGRYMRYSDDILIIIPSGLIEIGQIIDFVSDEIKKSGEKLEIKKTKTCVIQFHQQETGDLKYAHLKQSDNEDNKDGLEYLGFRYDGRKVYIRNGTISGFYRKMMSIIRREAIIYADKHLDLSVEELQNSFNISSINQKFHKIKKDKLFLEDSNEIGVRNFYSYVKRAVQIFGCKYGEKGDRIMRQLHSSSRIMENRIKQAIIKKANRKTN